MKKIYDIYGIGNPLVDVLSQVDDSVLDELEMTKGIMQLIDSERRKKILTNIPSPTLAPGGSCANTLISLADFGLNVVYAGGIGDDDFGNQFESGLKELNVLSALKRKTLPTGSSIILISQDCERTMNTYLGSCQEFSKEDVDEGKLLRSKMLYFTGYMWDTPAQKEAICHAINLAKKNSIKIIFDVADPFAVDRSRDDFLRLIMEDADFVFANEKEAQSMTGNEEIEDVLHKMMALTRYGVVKAGKQGSYVFNNGKILKIEPFSVNALDTTGAGDMYAAGLIYGLAKGYDLERSGRIASYVSSRVVESIGARLSFSLRGKIDEL